MRPAAFLAAAALLCLPARAELPEDHRTLRRTTSYDEMKRFLEGVDGKGPVSVSVEGTSTKGRSLYLVRLSHGGTPAWKLFLYAQQHGDELSGKDALLYLIRDVARDPALLPRDVEVWAMPMVNPDGAEAGTRENGAGADLNRDHMTLDQPETQAVHRVARRVRPDVAVDCHEFSRDSDSWKRRGWEKWPDITMDGLDTPLFDPGLVAAARRWVDESAAVEEAAGHRFLRYWVGGAPPDDEQRPSAPDVDGGLNAIGAYGGLSFIIEAAVRHGSQDPSADLGNRVDAYLALLRRFVAGGSRRADDLAAIAAARKRPLPPFLPTNYLWVNPGPQVTGFPVIEVATGRTLTIPTPNLMTTMAVKRSVPTPLGYSVAPPAAPVFAALLTRHGIPFETVTAPRPARVESVKLLRVEEEFDDLYERYGGRAVTSRGEPVGGDLPAGSLWVPLRGETALRASLLLEPLSLYGLYRYPRYRALVGADGVLPVRRVVALPGAAPPGRPR